MALKWACGILCLLCNCAHTPALPSYKYYGLDFDASMLRGEEAKDDRKLMDCRPTDQSKSPCVVMFEDDFYNFLQDYLELKNQLVGCQKK